MQIILDKQWNGAPAMPSLPLELIIEHDTLTFSVEFPKGSQAHPESINEAFTEELWLWDVAELFIAGKNGRYLEVNLAPNGAYWMQGFLAPRLAEPDFNPDIYHPISIISFSEIVT